MYGTSIRWLKKKRKQVLCFYTILINDCNSENGQKTNELFTLQENKTHKIKTNLVFKTTTFYS